jgi:hypothetical protein
MPEHHRTDIGNSDHRNCTYILHYIPSNDILEDNLYEEIKFYDYYML